MHQYKPVRIVDPFRIDRQQRENGKAARYAGLSQSMLNRLFRRYLGRTAAGFLQQLRGDRMKNLLDSTGFSLSAVAAQTGYSSPVSLSLAFRRATGMQPGAYRELRRG